MLPRPYTLIAELSYQCPLHCPYCSNPLHIGAETYRRELETEDWIRAFEEARRHLGLETQRQWSDLAILRTTPALLGLFSLVTLWAARLEAEHSIAPECVRWYPKRAPTFSDALALVRRELWMAPTFASSPDHRDVLKVPADVLDRLIRVACRPP